MWKDKSGLKVQADDSTIVEDTLDQMNRLEFAKRGMSHKNELYAEDTQRTLKHQMIVDCDVLPVSNGRKFKLF